MVQLIYFSLCKNCFSIWDWDRIYHDFFPLQLMETFLFINFSLSGRIFRVKWRMVYFGHVVGIQYVFDEWIGACISDSLRRRECEDGERGLVLLPMGRMHVWYILFFPHSHFSLLVAIWEVFSHLVLWNLRLWDLEINHLWFLYIVFFWNVKMTNPAPGSRQPSLMK